MTLTTLILNRTRDDVKIDLTAIITHGAIGTGTTTPAVGDTALTNEVFEDTIADFSTAVVNQITASLEVTTTEANGNSISEVGFKDGLTGTALLWTHDLITAINKTSDIALWFDETITINVTEG